MDGGVASCQVEAEPPSSQVTVVLLEQENTKVVSLQEQENIRVVSLQEQITRVTSHHEDEDSKMVSQHTSSTHNSSIAQFTCTLCGKSLRDPHTLKCHVKTVHGEKKFSCPTCDKKFPHRGVLNAHMKTHSEASFTCSICNESIKDSSYFKKHVRSHTEARSHQCPVCDKTYIQKSHLTVHMSIHSDHKPYQCDVCDKSFRLAKAYKEHMNMHANNRNLKCPHCPYASCFQKNLQVHVRNHAKKTAKSKKASNTPLFEKGTGDNLAVKEKLAVKQELISNLPSAVPLSCQDPLGEMESPVYLLVNLESEENLAAGIHDMESLNPLEMAQELCITSSQPDKLDEDYRPLDLSIDAPQDPTIKRYRHGHQNSDDIFGENGGGGSSGNAAEFPSENGSSFENLDPIDTSYTAARSEGGSSPSDLTADQYLHYQAENPGRRRSVFLAEQLDYEHQGEMRVVDPTEVTG